MFIQTDSKVLSSVSSLKVFQGGTSKAIVSKKSNLASFHPTNDGSKDKRKNRFTEITRVRKHSTMPNTTHFTGMSIVICFGKMNVNLPDA